VAGAEASRAAAAASRAAEKEEEKERKPVDATEIFWRRIESAVESYQRRFIARRFFDE
jgi:hypothetical protein